MHRLLKGRTVLLRWTLNGDAHPDEFTTIALDFQGPLAYATGVHHARYFGIYFGLVVHPVFLSDKGKGKGKGEGLRIIATLS